MPPPSHSMTNTAPPQNMSPMSMAHPQRLPMAQQHQMRQPIPGHPAFDANMSSHAGPMPSGNYIQGGPMMGGPQQQMAPYQQ